MSIVRMYDIRGIFGEELTEDYTHKLGSRLANYLNSKYPLESGNDRFIMVGYDARESSPLLHDILVESLTDMGIGVISIGQVTSGVASVLDKTYKPDATVMITASHNPKEYNGFKIIVKGQPLHGESLYQLANFLDMKFSCMNKGLVTDESHLVTQTYVPMIVQHFINRPELEEVRKLKIAVDCSNGSSGPILAKVLEELGLDIPLTLSEADGTFPVHLPDPSKLANWTHIKSEFSEGNQMLFMLDGDGDRVGVMTDKGTLLTGDKVLSIIAEASEHRNTEGKILLDVKSSELVREHIESLGYYAKYHQTGHSLIKRTMAEDLTILMAGEESGHLYIRDTFLGVDDAIYNLLRFIFDSVKIRAHEGLDSYVSSRIPVTRTISVKVEVPDSIKSEVMELATSKLIAYAEDARGDIITLDGVRVNTYDGWFVVRQSNTEPYIGITIELYDKDSESDVQSQLTQIIKDAVGGVSRAISK